MNLASISFPSLWGVPNAHPVNKSRPLIAIFAKFVCFILQHINNHYFVLSFHCSSEFPNNE